MFLFQMKISASEKCKPNYVNRAATHFTATQGETEKELKQVLEVGGRVGELVPSQTVVPYGVRVLSLPGEATERKCNKSASQLR